MRPAVMARALSLAFALATVCSSQIDERCPSTALEQGPKLLGSLQALKDAARNEGYDGRLLFRLTVTDTGSVRNLVVKHPEQLIGSDKIKGEIAKLRFCPAVRYSRYAEVQMDFDIQTK